MSRYERQEWRRLDKRKRRVRSQFFFEFWRLKKSGSGEFLFVPTKVFRVSDHFVL